MTCIPLSAVMTRACRSAKRSNRRRVTYRNGSVTVSATRSSAISATADQLVSTLVMYQCPATLTSMPTAWVSDEVWAQLDPHQTRLAKRARRAVALLVAVATAGTVFITLGVV